MCDFVWAGPQGLICLNRWASAPCPNFRCWLAAVLDHSELWLHTRQGLQWDLSAEWSMLQTIYEGESSFSTTEGRVGHQQLPNQSKMHNVNNSGDHTARFIYSSWGIFLSFFFFSPLFAFQSLSFLYLWICSYFSAIFCASRAHIHSLPVSRTLNSLRSAGLLFCVKKELKASRHSNVVGSGTSSWIKVFALVMVNAASWFVSLSGIVTSVCVRKDVL